MVWVFSQQNAIVLPFAAIELTIGDNMTREPATTNCSTPEPQYFIVDIRHDWRKQKYITFWRPNNNNYAWPLSWAGRYDKSVVDSEASYYCNTNGRKELIRFPVACEIVEAMALTEPDKGDIDGNAGPVLRNSEKVRRKLRAEAYIPQGAVTTAVGA